MAICFCCSAIDCKEKKAAASAVEPRAAIPQPTSTQAVSIATPQTTALSAQANQAVSPVLDCDAICQQAKSAENADIRKSMQLLEAAIAKAPDDPRSAPYYLQLGKLKKEYEDYQGYNAGTSESTEKQRKEFAEYAKARPTEYSYDEIGAGYLYLGTHFKELEKKFPASPLVVEAAYEMTKLSAGGECEGSVNCYLERDFGPVRDFLRRYPESSHTAEAAQRAQDAFRKLLWGDSWRKQWTNIEDLNKENDDYDPTGFKKTVNEYEELAKKLPPQFRQAFGRR